MKASTLFLSILIFSALIGCTHTVQTTSGQAYLKKHPPTKKSSVVATFTKAKKVNHKKYGVSEKSESIDIETAIRQAAAVEPTLYFPARIGLARIEDGRLTPLPAAETEIWVQLKQRLEPDFGEFVPISTIVADMVRASLEPRLKYQSSDAMNQIRLAAARQHLDAVLVYEILSDTGLTIVGGYFAPSQELHGKGVGHALLIDVIQGYPYANAQASFNLDQSTATRNTFAQQQDLSQQVNSQVTTKLALEVEEMFKKLRWQLAETRLKPRSN